MEEEKGLDLSQYLSILSRFKYLIVISGLLGLLGGYITLKNTPEVYYASTLILIEPPKVTGDVAGSTTGMSVEDRLNLIRQQITSRSLLEPVLRDLNLYSGQDDASLAGAVDSFRSSLWVDTSTTGSGNQRNVISFRIGFEHRDPRIAMEVPNRVAALFLEQNEAVLRSRIQGTMEFLDSELERLRETLEGKEKTIAEFRTQFMGQLPEHLGNNLGALDRYREQLKATEEQLMTTKERRTSLRRLVGEGRVKNTLGERLAQVKTTLAQMTPRFKDTYPDIQMLRSELAILERRIKEEGPETVVAPEDEEAPNSENSGGIHGRVEELDIEIATLEHRKKTIQGQIGEYDRRVEATPAREQELMILMRDYENIKGNYQALLDKRLGATLSTNLKAESMGEVFRVLDPAYRPVKPIRPIPSKIIGAGFAIGLACGFGIVILFAMNDSTCRRPDELMDATGLPVLAMIPEISQSRRRDPASKSVYAVAGKTAQKSPSASEGKGDEER